MAAPISSVPKVRDAEGLAGVEYDTINVLETLTLDFDPLNPMEIDLSSLAANDNPGLAANFDPTEDYEWTVLSAATITGFNPAGFLIDAADFFNPTYGSFSVVQDAGDLQLVYTGAPRPGDFDDDGDVDGRDFLLWQRDPNIGSLADWQANYGAPALAAITAASPAVPEPTTSVLLPMVVCTFICSRRLIRD